MPLFKDDHIAIIAPGSQTTLAQLGLPESYTPARLRLPTRMFPAQKPGQFEPVKIRERVINGSTAEEGSKEDEEQDAFEEDPTSDEGAIYPLQNGEITDWPCFLAYLTYVYNTLSPPFHTPVLIVTQPCWTAVDKENITQFFFEKFGVPALSLMDSALSTLYGYGVPSATIVDVGYGKSDVTAISDFLIHDIGRGIALEGTGGEAMSERLLKLLAGKEFDHDMVEQLKRSAICEILPPGTALPTDSLDQTQPNPAAAATTGIDANASAAKASAIVGGAPRGPGAGTVVGGEDDENDGVLDIASIVASGKASEILAKKEQEKTAKLAAKKGGAAEAPKVVKLSNAQKVKAVFHYDAAPESQVNGNGKRAAEDHSAMDVDAKRQKTPEIEGTQPAVDGNDTSLASIPEPKTAPEAPVSTRKQVEVGVERFQAADGILDEIAAAIHRAITTMPEPSKRTDLWDNLIICGNGSRIRGFKEALLQTLQTRYLITPPSNSIFTADLPSAYSTPVATGANTPQPGQEPTHGSGVNPLLLAATSGNMQSSYQQNPNIPQNYAAGAQQPQQFPAHAQTPQSIKFVKPPEYFPEWKESGLEEAVFLGAQVAAKVLFVVDQGASKGFMSRTEYNELGPMGIHECSL